MTNTNFEIDRQIGGTVLKQIGGMTLAACGAREFVVGRDKSDQTFILMTVGRRQRRIKVTLTHADLYDVEFIKIGNAPKMELTTLEHETHLYADMLTDTIYHMVNK